MDGFYIIKAHETPEGLTATFNNSEITKKYEESPLEVNLYKFPANSGFSIDCPVIETAAKSYFIVSGKSENLETGTVLSPGDLRVVRKSDEYLNLYMHEETIILVHAVNMESFKVIERSVANVSGILESIQVKDSYTSEHCGRVFKLVYAMSLRLGYSGKKLYNILRAARYHDIGKIFIDGNILAKPEKLTADEYREMQKHVMLGKELILDSFGEEIFAIISQHHERVDGSGYPFGLVGSSISEEGRVMAICDTFDAMTTDRVYKKAMTQEDALAELMKGAGVGYDAKLMETFISMLANRHAFLS